MYQLDVKTRISVASITPKRAVKWIAAAEDPEIKDWRDLPEDPAHLRSLSHKCKIGFMPFIEQKNELKLRVEMDMLEFAKTHEMMSGRALYWIILNELRVGLNTVGLMNISDLHNVNCRGPTIHHLRMLHTYWDKCLFNFNVVPDVSILLPLFETQVRLSTAFKPTIAIYDYDLVSGKETDRSYSNLKMMVKHFLEIEHVNENNQAAEGGRTAVIPWHYMKILLPN